MKHTGPGDVVAIGFGVRRHAGHVAATAGVTGTRHTSSEPPQGPGARRRRLRLAVHRPRHRGGARLVAAVTDASPMPAPRRTCRPTRTMWPHPPWRRRSGSPRRDQGLKAEATWLCGCRRGQRGRRGHELVSTTWWRWTLGPPASTASRCSTSSSQGSVVPVIVRNRARLVSDTVTRSTVAAVDHQIAPAVPVRRAAGRVRRGARPPAVARAGASGGSMLSGWLASWSTRAPGGCRSMAVGGWSARTCWRSSWRTGRCRPAAPAHHARASTSTRSSTSSTLTSATRAASSGRPRSRCARHGDRFTPS